MAHIPVSGWIEHWVSVNLCEFFPLAAVGHITAATSDHSAVLLHLAQPGGEGKKTNQFRYEIMWDTHPDLKLAVQSGWELNSHNPRVCEVRANLEALARILGAWSKSTFGSVKGEIRTLK